MTGEPVRTDYRMPGEAKAIPSADAVLACPLTFNSVNKFAHGHADNFAIGLLCELTGYGVPVVVVPHCKPQLASHQAFPVSIATLRSMGVTVLFDPDAPYERRLPPWHTVVSALPTPHRGQVTMDQHETGQRIARARRRRGLSQAALAGLVGRSESWLSQVERGKRGIDSHVVLTQMTEVLRVDITELTEPDRRDAARSRSYPSARQIEHAMVSYTALEDSISSSRSGGPWDIRNMEGRIKAAYNRYQATRYEEVGRLLPALITDAEAASRAAGPGDTHLCRIRAHVYDTAAALLNRVGERALAWTAADRAISAAEQSGQPLMTALGAYRLTYVLASRKHPREALELAMTAVAALGQSMRAPSPQPDQLSVYGGLHLAAANAAALQYESATSTSLLRKAEQLARQLGRDANLMGTAFGPVNVAIHSMSASARLGDWTAVIRTGESLDATAIPAGLIGRRTQVKLDLARAYAMRRQDAAAVNTVLAAEQLSPQLVRLDTSTQDVLTGLLRREHRASSPQLRPLAHRAGLI